MGSTFSSLNAALSGLYAAQRLVEVSGHNIENMNTEGYTRQRVSQKALGISSTPSIFAGSVTQGGGVESERLQRMGDIFLDTKLRLETARAGVTSEVSKAWTNIESAMDEMGEQSVTKSLTNFYKSWGDVNNSSDNNGARSTVLGNANALVAQIKQGYTRIGDLWKDGRAKVDAYVQDINTTMDSVAALNKRIVAEKTAGADVNELIDQRNLLALKLSQLTGSTAREREDGSLEIMLAGNSMVSRGDVNHFEVRGSADMPGIDAAPKKVYEAAEAELAKNPDVKSIVDAQTADLQAAADAIEYAKIDGAKNPSDPGYSSDLAEKKLAANPAWPTVKPVTAGSITFVHNGIEQQRYQAQVQVDSTTGKEFIAFYDMAKVTGEVKDSNGKPFSMEQSMVAGTKKEFELKDFQTDEGPVRLVWTGGGHQVVMDEGTLGGVLKNLAPATRPYVAGTIGNGGSWAETGKLYNDIATKLADEINTLHAAGGNKTLSTANISVTIKDPSLPEGDGNPRALINSDLPSEIQGEFETVDDKLVLKRQANETEAQFALRSKTALDKLQAKMATVGEVVLSQTNMENGGDFFKFAASDNKLPPALRLSVAISDPAKIAAGKEVNGIYDGSVAYAISQAQDKQDSSINQWSNSVVDIGVHTSGAEAKADLAEQTRIIAERAHASATGVDMNEEVVALIQGQHAYAGAARVMSTVNEMLDTLINLGR